MSSAILTTDDVVLPPEDCPLRLAEADDFARARALFARAGYREETLCRVLNVPEMADVVRHEWTAATLDSLSSRLRLCINLFLRAQPVAQAEVTALCGSDTVACLLTLGLLRPSRRNAEQVVPTVWLAPVGNFVLAADLPLDPDEGEFELRQDAVFPATESVTHEFLHFLPNARHGIALDLCGGCGIGALCNAQTARLSVTADLTARAAFFAAFNGRLNDTPIVSRCGNLYEPFNGQQFDLITAHPPYVPDVGKFMVYRDGGETGEAITRRIIEGIPPHLRPGGTCVIVGFARDTNKQPFEQRAREWLGEAAGEFDIIFGVTRSRTIEEFSEGQRRRLKEDVEGELKRLQQRLRDLDTREFVHGALFIRRCTAPVATKPLRVRITSKASPADFERLFDWRVRRQQPGFLDWLAGTRTALAPHLELHTRQVVKDGQFVDAEMTFRIEREFETALRPDAWIVPIISRLDGRRSVAEVFATAQAAGELPPRFHIEDFAGLLDLMIERGYLTLDLPS